ncbi:tryptophanase [Peloplasma aerotolerans]|uniref:Tryptophanase n=1 Tax=Peloplasma aerotolerans TaxID=3044389 RepID=A0AAW6UB45_9MOLU|nr:tryptophanase [Mariniplasma sp. M4Ah]MDI6453356.1 tryptophanase [Mariniplasma sp. M4Ah]
MKKKYAAEPYRIKVIEHIRQTTKEERIKILKNAGYNPFSLRSEDVYIDLLTDSGTSAMSQEQWSALMIGDEAYAGSRSFYRLESVVKNITNYQYFIPAHQGRGAEQVFLPQLVTKKGMYYISNIHFDTTRSHVELAGARAIDCVIDDCFDLQTYHPFKGNFCLNKLEKTILDKGKENIAGIIMTITNNSAGGQPVSMENMRQVSEMAKKYGITTIIDGARYAENAFFIKEREEGYQDMDIIDIAREAFSYADVLLMSAKKDGLVNMGGFIAIKDHEELYNKCRTYIVPMEGFPTYGGMNGRDMDALAVGLMEALDENYLRHRIDQVRYLGDRLREAGVPVQYPIGGHAVFVDCKSIAPHIPYDQFPAQSVTNAIYIEAGVRAVEIGSLLLGRDPDTHENIQSEMELMRLTIPRRVYTYRHLDVVADAVIHVFEHRSELKGLAFVYEPPILRHFTAVFKPIDSL